MYIYNGMIIKVDKIDYFVNAIIQNDMRAFNSMLKLGIDVNELDTQNDSSPIMYASQKGRTEMIIKLLEHGAAVDVNIVIGDDNVQKSALYFALVNTHCVDENQIYKCAKLLIRANANIESLSKHKTAYLIAQAIKKEIEAEKDNIDIDTLVKAIMNKDMETFNRMLDKNINVDRLDSEYQSTPIMFAAEIGQVDMIKKLLSHNASLNDIEVDGKVKNVLLYALHYSKCENDNDKYQCARLLIKAGADIEFMKKEYKVSYILAKSIKQELEAENDNMLTTTNGTLVPIPRNIVATPILQMLYDQKKPKPTYNLVKIQSRVKISFLNGEIWQHFLSTKNNFYVEIPVNEKINFHYLPKGIELNGIVSSKEYICKIDDFIDAENYHFNPNEIYL